MWLVTCISHYDCVFHLQPYPPSPLFLPQTSDGAASFLVFLRFLSMLRSQALDSGDLLEALEQSGSSSDDAEELVGRVVSLTSTNEFFVPLALQHLRKVREKSVACVQPAPVLNRMRRYVQCRS